MRNKIVAGLLVVTGVLFSVAALSSNPEIIVRTSALGYIAGVSAIFTRLLIKEKENG